MENLENQVTETDQMYLDQIEELKNRIDNEMVPKEELVKLQAQHKKLLDEYVNRRPVVKNEVKIRPAKELAAELMKAESGNMLNRDYVALALEYRDAFIKERGQDPFSNSILTNKGVEFEKAGTNEDANEIAAGFKHILDNSEDSVSFNIRLGSIMQDDQGIISKIRKNRK